MLRPDLILALSLLVACGGGGDTTTGDTDASTTAASTTAASTTASETGSATDAPTTDAPTTNAPTTGDDSGTTGGAAFCNGWDGDDGELELVLRDKDGNTLADGSTLPLECGAQGLFMFGLYPTFGGFTPDSDYIAFDVEVDVEGFNTNPEGHFSSGNYLYYLGCEPLDGGVSGVVAIFPLDNLPDLAALDGLPAAVHLVLATPDGDITLDLQLKLSVVKDDSWTFCGG